MPSKSISTCSSRYRCYFPFLNMRLAIYIILITLIIATTGQDVSQGSDKGAGAGGRDGANAAIEGDETNKKNVENPILRVDKHATVHEKLGQVHFPKAYLTPFESKAIYSVEMNYTTWPIHPAYNFTHMIFDSIVSGKPALPPGYLMVKNETILALGPKVEQNDWSELIAEYFLVILWIVILLALIILMPFIAICYCCFCCCRRCKMGCPPCDGPREKRQALILSISLLILTIIVLISAIMALFASRFLDRGFNDTSNTLKRGSKDICTFLRDISENIYHVFVRNYEEMEQHLNTEINEAASHILLDLGDVSESNSIAELERILDNMYEARTLIKQLDTMHKDLLFNAAQLRDGVRDSKRRVLYSCAKFFEKKQCEKFMDDTDILFLDSSVCLHLDKVPETELYVASIDNIIKQNLNAVIRRGLFRHGEIAKHVTSAVDVIAPPIQKELNRGREIFLGYATNLRNIIDAVISDIHLRALRTAQSFEDVNDKYGADRTAINLICFLLIMLIAFVLIVSLIMGCFINKNTAANCLLLAIILIFIVFSFILLVALFYFVIGLITYQGACAPLRDREDNPMFQHMDSVLDIKKLVINSGAVRDPPRSTPLRVSTAIKACMANQSIFDVLRINKLYKTDDILTIKVLSAVDDKDKQNKVFDYDLSQKFLFTDDEMTSLLNLQLESLSSYHSINYLEAMCKQLTPNLPDMAAKVRTVSNKIISFSQYGKIGKISLLNEAMHLYMYEKKYTGAVIKIMDNMKEKLLKIDDLILYENRNFSNTIEVLVNAVIRSQNFMKSRGNKFINKIVDNLTDVINDQLEAFTEGVMSTCNTKIGSCRPLAYIYFRGVRLLCDRIVDPMNAFWLGILICALAFIPIMILCHRLMCLWRRLHSYAVVALPVAPILGCPTCTGAPYVPPPIITCTGGKQDFCVCSQTKLSRTDGGGAPSSTTFHVNVIVDDLSLGEVTSVPSISSSPHIQATENSIGSQPNTQKSNKSKED